MKGKFLVGLVVGIAIGGGVMAGLQSFTPAAKPSPPSISSKSDLFLGWDKDAYLAALLPLPDGVFYLESNFPYVSNGWRVDTARIIQMQGRDFSLAEVEAIFHSALKKCGWQPSVNGLDKDLFLREGDAYAKISQFEIGQGPESPYDQIRLKIGFKADGMTIDCFLKARKR